MSAGEYNGRDIYVVTDNIVSPLGNTTGANFAALRAGKTSVQKHHYKEIAPEAFAASLFKDNDSFYKGDGVDYTRFERLAIASASEAINNSGIDTGDDKTIFILSSTKGNISLLETEEDNAGLHQRVSLATSANLIAAHFGFPSKPVVVSNACISGVLAIITAMRLIRSGEYDTAVITGADVISKFIVSGFQSFHALSNEVCKPFDRDRDGLNLGEGAGTIILSADNKYSGSIKVLGGAVSNDANHISGPSRTGEELAGAINNALKDAVVAAADINFISAHGTATPYNDEMEAAAITLAGLQNAPLNSLKGNYGHTLGAAGIIETVISLQSLKQGLLMPTIGYQENGVTHPVKVCTAVTEIDAKTFLKTASGFGGCNGAIIFGK
ncbi:beta-ketoacyl-[acyl-carrier-protein] synthase family protein [Mucilaginibacter glaciei]|uniref:Beta-ketoacyl synthase n=1 Tax=Mucilaginibacter glaciei TaxID=2772109 RepID=A0A926S109_9SPHI|nr:beta-ketoacyl synthase N-terminal-like domain-containing protein [Mucilaginibacter glaciei]MBD1391674.1 beta-ketoacyl synthase [Mucilaginibacter glaciei]